MNKLDKIFSQSENVGAFATGYLNYLNQVLAGFNVEDISAFVNILEEVRARDVQIFFMAMVEAQPRRATLLMISLLEHVLLKSLFEQLV